jgi:hypothetical protein
MALVFSLATTACAADSSTPKTVQDFKQSCENRDSPDQLFCVGYIAGVAQMMIAIGVVKPSPEAFAMCPGEPFPSYGADLQVFINWADKHPEKWAEKAFFGVVESLRDKWPCH